MAGGSYLRPLRLDEALAALDSAPRMIVAGGTDYYPARVGRPLDDDVLDITALPGLRRIADLVQAWRIPALATWTDLIEADLPPLFDALKLAAREVGGVQIQNAGTICGNLCNASPAADGIPVLMALDAAVELVSKDGRRVLPVTEFVLGNRRTARRPDELVASLIVPKLDARSNFLKLGARKYLVISIVMVAVVLAARQDGRIGAARIAVGSCAATAKRLPELEAELIGRALDARIARLVDDRHLTPLAPIDDVRATAAYRRDATLTLLRRTIVELAA
jgi:CO/xanthine dehydrogenase FAD-binding subunit